MVKFVISPEFFGINESRNKIKEQLEMWGAKEVSFSDENFVMALMSETQFEEFMLSMRNKIDEYIAETVKSYNLTSITHDNEYMRYTAIGKNLSESDMKNIAFEILMASASYQVFNGIPQNETSVIVNFKNTPKGKIIYTVDTSKENKNE